MESTIFGVKQFLGRVKISGGQQFFGGQQFLGVKILWGSNLTEKRNNYSG
jgi:hypothetical protein